jgi:hypothetical protein
VNRSFHHALTLFSAFVFLYAFAVESSLSADAVSEKNISAASVLIPLPSPVQPPNIVPLSTSEQLGKDIFYDATLSNPAGYSCATCHNPQTGFTGPSSALNLAAGPLPGVIPGRFGRRNSGWNFLGWPHAGHRNAGANAILGSKRNGQHADRPVSAARGRLFSFAGAENFQPALRTTF